MSHVTDHVMSNVLNYTGLLVTLIVGSLCAWTVYDTTLFLPVAALCAVYLACFGLFILHPNRARSRLLLLFWVEGVLLSLLFYLVSEQSVAILSIVWVVQAAGLFGLNLSFPLMAACLMVFGATQINHRGAEDVLGIAISMSIYGLLQMFAIGMVHRADEERRLREQTASLNRELLATRELLSQTSAHSERLRIARDLHDILGHHMTALILNLEVASHSVEGKALEKVQQSLSMAKLLLGDLRSAVSEMREDSAIELSQAIHTLVRGIPNVAFDIDFSKAPVITNVEQAETLLRCAQEAITNVVRHSRASHCRIAVVGDPNGCTLSVTDNGVLSRDRKAIKPGNGLKGMEERVKASGGKLLWQRNPDGFHLEVTLAGGTGA